MRRGTGGFSLVELLIVMVIIAVVAAIGMAGWRNAKVRGNEASALASLTAINHAQFAYAQTCGHGRFAPTLLALKAPAPATDHGFLEPDLAREEPVTKSGYMFVYGGTEDPDLKVSCSGVAGVLTYRVTADPLTPNVTGMRFFGTNKDRIIYSDSVTYTGNMPETGAPAHGSEIK